MSPKSKPIQVKTTPVEAQPEGAKEDKRLPFFRISRRVLLAAVGAAALAQDEIEEFINRLVERGEIAEMDGRKLMQEIVQHRKAKREKIKEEAGKRIGAAFARMDIPT